MSFNLEQNLLSNGGLGDRHQQNDVNYTLDLNAGLTQVLADGTNTYLYGNGRISQHTTQTEYFLGDALGSVRQLADSAGAVTLTQSYTPYGDVASSVGTSQTNYAFTGEIRDANGLTYLRARYYAPTDGRFISRDTWNGDYSRPLSLNRWNYVEGNPVNKIDPTGHYAVSYTEYNTISNQPSAQSQIYLALAQTGSMGVHSTSDCYGFPGEYESHGPADADPTRSVRVIIGIYYDTKYIEGTQYAKVYGYEVSWDSFVPSVITATKVVISATFLGELLGEGPTQYSSTDEKTYLHPARRTPYSFVPKKWAERYITLNNAHYQQGTATVTFLRGSAKKSAKYTWSVTTQIQIGGKW